MTAALVAALVKLTEVEILGLTGWGEARGEPVEGQIAVMQTVANRSRKHLKSIRDVCLAPEQYSCWNDDPNSTNDNTLGRTVIAYVLDPASADPILGQCLALAKSIAAGSILDNTFGATHYVTRACYATNPPLWVKDASGRLRPPSSTILNHLFFVGIA